MTGQKCVAATPSTQENADVTNFTIGDRVRVKPETAARLRASGYTSPTYGHITSLRASGTGLVWVRDSAGTEWGLPAYELEHID